MRIDEQWNVDEPAVGTQARDQAVLACAQQPHDERAVIARTIRIGITTSTGETHSTVRQHSRQCGRVVRAIYDGYREAMISIAGARVHANRHASSGRLGNTSALRLSPRR